MRGVQTGSLQSVAKADRIELTSLVFPDAPAPDAATQNKKIAIHTLPNAPQRHLRFLRLRLQKLIPNSIF